MIEGKSNDEFLGRARRIELLLMDCDGVLTDGRLYYSARGEELKVFNVKDGMGLTLWHRAGFRSGIITGRRSGILELRAAELGVEFLRQGSADKVADFEQIIDEAGVTAEKTAFIGDDVIDLAVMDRAGLAVAVADSVGSLFEKADYITRAAGGNGAVREVIDLLLAARNSRID